MSQPELLKKQLYQFAAHIRDPDNSPSPDNIEDRRMGIYRNLFFNNVKDFLGNTFPVLKSLYEEDAWLELARSFYAIHRCQSPYFLEISREFLEYLQTEHNLRDIDPPYLLELAHYEWIELALSISQEKPDLLQIDTESSLLDGHPVMSPLAWLMTYTWPVHQISYDFRPEQPAEQVVCIIVYRDVDDDIQFTEINPVTARLLQQLEQNDAATGADVLNDIAKELAVADAWPILQSGLETLEGLKQKGIILGVARS
ncbi:MAG: DNA-binding domain-containing protein [Arenicellales bacterium]